MDTPSNTTYTSVPQEEEVEHSERTSEPTPGPVDAEILAKKLHALGGVEVGSQHSTDETEGQDSDVDESRGIKPPRPTAESKTSGLEKVQEEDETPIEILIGPQKKSLCKSDGEDELSEHIDQDLVVYGNVRMLLPKYPILLTKKDEVPFDREILKTFCMEKIQDLSPPKSIRIEAESVYWKRSLSCMKCPSEFNCTCEKDIGDVIAKLANSFDLIVIPNNTCTTCIKELDVVRRKNIIFCQINLDSQDRGIFLELKKYLNSIRNSSISSQIHHHYLHDGTEENDVISLFGERISLPPLNVLDIIVIGTNSAALAICEEAESCGVNVGVIDVDSNESSSLHGFFKTYYGYGVALKTFLLEASLVREAIRIAPFCAIQETQNIGLDWSQLRINAGNYMNSLAWQRRLCFSKSGIFFVVGKPTFLDRNTVQVVSNQGVFELHAKFFVFASDTKLTYDHFSGLHSYCYKMHKLLSYNSLEQSKTLIYGSTISALEFAAIFASLGFEVTLMMNSKIHPKYDEDMMKKLTYYMKRNGVSFMDYCRIQAVTPVPRSASGSASVPNVLEKFMVISQSIETGKFFRNYFDNVVVVPYEEASYDEVYGLEDIGVEFCKHDPKLIEVNKNYNTTVTNFYAVGTMVPGLQDATKNFENIGRQLIKALSKNEKLDLKTDTSLYIVYGLCEYAFYGLSENLARERYENVVIYHSLYDALELALLPFRSRVPCYMKLVCKVEENAHKMRREVIIGMHVIGQNAAKIVSGYSSALSEGLTKERLDDLLGIDSTCASSAINITELKNADDAVLEPEDCCSSCKV